MDIIYRINVPPKVNGLLDNLDIAVGCLQKVVISNVIAKNIADNEVQRIVSIAGGSCIIPSKGYLSDWKIWYADSKCRLFPLRQMKSRSY